MLTNEAGSGRPPSLTRREPRDDVGHTPVAHRDAGAVTATKPRPGPGVPSSPQSRPHAGRIEGLDGIRALAIVAVLVFHLNAPWLPGGFLGVDVFFVVSGFLITTLLVREHERSGRIAFRDFWVRRARRLLPASSSRSPSARSSHDS